MTRACQCGGIIRQHQLTGEREAWTCNACGRYGAIARERTDMTDKTTERTAPMTMWARRFIRASRELGGKVLELDGSHLLITIGDGRLWFANPRVVCGKG